VWFVLTAVCAMGVSFYLWFLVAMFKACLYTRICHLVRLEPATHEEPIGEAVRKETILRRAA
jgi:hypothetical protein